jgi:two-component system phosphate regulon sensor histidine kinase PhoR
MISMSGRLFKKFALIYLFVVAASFLILAVLVERQLRQVITERITEELLSEGQIIAAFSLEEIQRRFHEMTRNSKARVTIINRNGIVIGDSSGESRTLDNHLNRPEVQESRLKGHGVNISYSGSLKMDMVQAAFVLKDAGQNVRGYVRLSRPLAEAEKAVGDFRKLLLMVIFSVLLLSGFLAFYFVRKVVRPVHKMADFTEMVIGGAPKTPLNINNRDEIGILAKNIQQMVAGLENRAAAETQEKQIIMSVFDSMSEGVIVLDARGFVKRANRSFLSMMGFSFDSIYQKSLLEILRDADLHDLLEQSQNTGETIRGEIVLDAGTELEVNISPIVDLPEGEKKTLLVFRDVSRLKKLERMRIDFVANVSHEIKTPLTTIIGFVETIEKTPPEQQETVRQFLRIIQDNAHRLNRMVNDLLTLSNIELGKTHLHFEEVSVREMTASILLMMKNIAAEKQLTLSMDIDENIAPLRADRDRLSQIMINLLGPSP